MGSDGWCIIFGEVNDNNADIPKKKKRNEEILILILFEGQAMWG